MSMTHLHISPLSTVRAKRITVAAFLLLQDLGQILCSLINKISVISLLIVSNHVMDILFYEV